MKPKPPRQEPSDESPESTPRISLLDLAEASSHSEPLGGAITNRAVNPWPITELEVVSAVVDVADSSTGVWVRKPVRQPVVGMPVAFTETTFWPWTTNESVLAGVPPRMSAAVEV